MRPITGVTIIEWAPSDLPMIEPIEIQKSAIDEMVLLRRTVVSCYSTIEFLLADISVKIDARFPYLVKARIRAIKRIGERPAYEAYANELSTICEELSKHDTFRNFMAHGLMAITSDSKNNHLFEFRLYQRQEKNST
jgi:hypothetical protein